MKFVTMRDLKGLTAGVPYDGTIVVAEEGKLKVVIYNDVGRWHAYLLGYFRPAE